MEDYNAKHSVKLSNRNSGYVTGIKNVDAFDEEMCVLLTEEERITIQGEDMHITKLDLDKGELLFDGRVLSIVYTDLKSMSKTGKGFLKRMFQ